MFSISFGETLLIIIVAILVLKPEDMVTTANSCGRLFAKIYRFFTETKSEIESKINNVE